MAGWVRWVHTAVLFWSPLVPPWCTSHPDPLVSSSEWRWAVTPRCERKVVTLSVHLSSAHACMHWEVETRCKKTHQMLGNNSSILIIETGVVCAPSMFFFLVFKWGLRLSNILVIRYFSWKLLRSEKTYRLRNNGGNANWIVNGFEALMILEKKKKNQEKMSPFQLLSLEQLFDLPAPSTEHPPPPTVRLWEAPYFEFWHLRLLEAEKLPWFDSDVIKVLELLEESFHP